MGFSLLGAIDFGAVAWEFICKMFFWITKTLAWLLDFFQLLFRKLVGLDTYYYNGVQVNPGENAVSGDII